ncbi:conserved hypothetical protein [Vibrio chagasii]|uniref:hypothetical protein n=1 Tax=Vibrio chagasii TaxID=170679 RepID=UPI0021B364DA|nr:hypothetical protein [Vibrio chagasii]CAH7080014.1 conserved hypothetical protein [Vibrio chagasii]CAH7094112.1 conserved hypothetical protein [Vibrio chagasii]CAH7286681.1 conserved hypothetical protein [Vibrio chagasii]CAH7325463.1 conserved hypothetical protein [Vibrio chagasii]CAH7334785.1 conserved hypothetical protein [Vibrio chagasii]
MIIIRQYFLLLTLLIFLVGVAEAKYTANFSGEIKAVLIYPGSTEILIHVEGMPSSHPTCSLNDYMSIDPTISSESRQLVMSRLLLAYSTKEKVNIGYDKEGNSDSCVGNRMKVYRVG